MASLAGPLRGEVAVIYSPDVREFRLDHIPVEIVRVGFWEIDELDQLRYKNHLHFLAEAEAAVKN